MYAIGDKRFSVDDPCFADALSRAYALHIRPLCCCRQPGAEMYIAKVGNTHVLKRMPNTGERHAASCTSYAPPASLSGLGELLGTAIQVNAADGLTTLKLDFAMSRKGRRSNVGGGGGESCSAKKTIGKLTLRGILHYLLDQAGLTRWSPAMDGKRNWWVVRKHLILAAQGKMTKGLSLEQRLFIPESFSVDLKDQLAQRRQRIFSSLAVSDGYDQPLMLLIAEVKELGSGKFAKNLRVKHMPDTPFLVEADLYQRVMRRFAAELSLWNAIANSHLMVAATFGVSATGIPAIEEMSLVVLDEHWLGVEYIEEKLLLDVLVRERRHFFKSLRYNTASDVALPSAILVGGPEPVALYIIPAWANEGFRLAVEEHEMNFTSWHWDTTVPMPLLPPTMSNV